jgi:hypothetical protein
MTTISNGIPPRCFTSSTVVPPPKLVVTNQFTGMSMACVSHNKVYAYVGLMYNHNFTSVDVTQPLWFDAFFMEPVNCSDQKTWLPRIIPMQLSLLRANQVVQLMYDKPYDDLVAGEILVEYTAVSDSWDINIVPATWPTLGYVVNSFGCKLLQQQASAKVPLALVTGVEFTIANQSNEFLTGDLSWGGSGATFMFQTFPEINNRAMLCDNAGYVYSGRTRNKISTWRSSVDSLNQEQWGVIPCTSMPLAQTASLTPNIPVVLVYTNLANLGMQVLVDGGLESMQSTLSLQTLPGWASFIGNANPANTCNIVLAAPVSSCSSGCTSLSAYDCPNGLYNCAAGLTDAGALQCSAVCKNLFAGSSVDPYKSSTITITSYLKSATVALTPGWRVLPVSASATLLNVLYPMTLNFTITDITTSTSATALQVEPFAVVVDVATNFTSVIYSATCGYQYKTYAQVVAAYDAATNSVQVTLRPYAPTTNGFVENSFGTPGTDATFAQDGFFAGNAHSLVPNAYFSMSPAGPISPVGPSPPSVYYSFITQQNTTRQLLAYITDTNASVQTLSRGVMDINCWGAMQLYSNGSSTANILMAFDGRKIQYWDASQWVAAEGAVVFDDPPGFARIVDGTFAGNVFTLAKFSQQQAVCWTQNLFGCPGNAYACKFSDTAAGGYMCTTSSAATAPTNFSSQVCFNVFASSQAGCNTVAGAHVTECTGWNSKNFQMACRQACNEDSTNCDTLARTLCGKSSYHHLPDCACINVEDSTYPVTLKNNMSYPEYECYISSHTGTGESNIDYLPKCWWPTCNVQDGAYVTSSLLNKTTREDTCPQSLVQCFNLVGNLNNFSSALQISIANSPSCAGIKSKSSPQTLQCTASSTNQFFIPPPPAPPVQTSSLPAGQILDLSKYFLSNGAVPKKPKTPPVPFWDPVVRAIIYGSGGLFILLFLILLMANYWKVYNEA